jgi:TolB-like protein/Flp pilus assembly protein TadD
VMDCGDAGHILISKHVAEDLEQDDRWRPLLHDLGTCEVKHGVRVGVTDLYSDEVGNPQLPKKFQALQKHRSRVRWAEVAIALLLLAAVVAAFIFVLRKPTRSTRSVAEKSIAVLPMVNSTGDPANEYFSDGMSEEFISSLSRLQELKVVGHTSSFQFKGKTDDSKTIGEKLGVYYLLEGSVRKSADRVRIAVALIKSGDGANVWSETYDRELKDIFAVQSEIAGAVAKQLKVALLGNNGQPAQLTTAATPSNQNVEAYNALLQGNFYYNRRTAEDTRKAIGYYEEAIRLDPRYALAFAKLSINALSLGTNYAGFATKEGQEALAKARVSAKSALELDPNLADAHSAQGRILELVDFNFAAAESEWRRAFELAPQDAALTAGLAFLLSDLGRLDEAVALTQRAIALEPLRAASHFNLAFYLTALGRYDEAEAALGKVIELQPQSAQNYAYLSRIQILRGKPGAAVELAKQETDPVWRTYALALAHFANGDRAEADAALKKMIDEYADDAGSQIAQVYALRKESEKMFEWLEHAWTTHDARCDRAAVRSFPACLQGRPALHRLRAKDRRDAESRRQSMSDRLIILDRSFGEGLLTRVMKDKVKAHAAFSKARAALGNKEATLKEGRRAIELLPVEKDSVNGSRMIQYFAVTAAWTGEKDLGLQQLEIGTRAPSASQLLSYGGLKLLPFWDPLRGDPRFEKIVAELAPK